MAATVSSHFNRKSTRWAKRWTPTVSQQIFLKCVLAKLVLSDLSVIDVVPHKDILVLFGTFYDWWHNYDQVTIHANSSRNGKVSYLRLSVSVRFSAWYLKHDDQTDIEMLQDETWKPT